VFAHSTASTTTPAAAPVLRNPRQAAAHSVNRGDVSVMAERKHLSLIVYAVPSERVQVLLPDSFQAEETMVGGRAMAWVSVESFFDQSAASHTAFEQTDYVLHARHNGRPGSWLLGSSLGSLSAVGVRNLWPMPWHLGAMEIRAAYDKLQRRYHEYSLQTQSQWVNSTWRIGDTGCAIDPAAAADTGVPATLFRHDVSTFFARRDGSVGARRIVRFNLQLTRGKLKQAQCDLLERLGLLTREELMCPALVALQHSAVWQLFPSTVLGEQLFESDRPRLAYAS
jgi:hypothetical protein